MLHIKFGFDWPSGFRGEDVWILWKYTCILPRGGGIEAPGDQSFSESLIFSPTVHFLQDIHFKWHFKSFPPFKCIGDLCWPCHKIGEGHHRVMIYIYIVVLESSILHVKFRWNRSTDSASFRRRRFLKGFTIYGHGGHLGHVTWIIYIYIGYPIL